MSANAKTYGLLAQFDTAAGIFEAALQVRDAGYRKWDVFTPFPIHGMDDAMGLKSSKVGYFTFCGGFTGFFTGMTMIWFMNKFDYPLVVGGKPLFKSERFKKATDDKFFICIEATDPKFAEARAMLEKAGAAAIELVED